MPLATAFCPISGRSVVLMTLLVVVAEDEVGDAAGLGLSLGLVRQSVHRLGAAVQGLHLGYRDVHADAAPDAQRRGEADAVEAVVEDDAETVDRADLPQQPGGQAQGQ